MCLHRDSETSQQLPNLPFMQSGSLLVFHQAPCEGAGAYGLKNMLCYVAPVLPSQEVKGYGAAVENSVLRAWGGAGFP